MRTKRALALVIAVMVSASLLAGLFYAMPSLFHRRGVIIVRAYAIRSDGDPVRLTNASFSVWAWAPTPNGTEFMPVYNGTGAQAVINLTRLVGWAKDWIHAYGKAAIRSFEPSMIIWVSYPIALPNGSVELVTQPSFQPINLSLPLSGSGAVINVMVDHPFRTLLNGTPLKANGREAGVAVRGLAKASPEQTTTTTVTTTLTTSTSIPLTGWLFCPWYCQFYATVPYVIGWYPNNESMAPISLAIALAQPSSVSISSGVYTSMNIIMSVTSSNIKQFSINGLTIAGSAFDAAMKDAEAGDLFQAISQLSPLLGTTFTFTTEGQITEYNNTAATTSPLTHDDIGQLYMVGQAALVNWTEFQITMYPFSLKIKPVGWYLGLQLTEFKAVENNGAVAPVVYAWEAYDPCVNPSEWAWEQQLLMQDPGDFYGYGVNSTCPLPNTPAPVIWQDYAMNLTHYADVSPHNLNYDIAYVDLSVNGGESPLGIGLDLGSAIASIIGTTLMTQPETAAAGAVLEVIGGVLGAIQYQYNSVAETANYIVINNYLPYYVNVYFSNLTPVYYNASGYGFTLPHELILINVAS